MTNNPILNQLNRKGFVLNWLAVIRNQRIIKDTLLVVVIVLLVVWVILLLGKVNEYKWYTAIQADIIETFKVSIIDQAKIINSYKKDILIYQEAVSSKDGIIIIGELEPPEAVK